MSWIRNTASKGGKTMLNGFASPSRIFRLAFELKKIGEKKSAVFLKLL
jgi:hypothetical protein